jgi:hypothetical protein
LICSVTDLKDAFLCARVGIPRRDPPPAGMGRLPRQTPDIIDMTCVSTLGLHRKCAGSSSSRTRMHCASNKATLAERHETYYLILSLAESKESIESQETSGQAIGTVISLETPHSTDTWLGCLRQRRSKSTTTTAFRRRIQHTIRTRAV